MCSLQRNVSCLFTVLLALSALMIGTNAHAQTTYPDRPGPDKGGFDWTQFQGKYDSSGCRSGPLAIWGNSAPGTFVQIDHEVAYTSNSTWQGLEVLLANDRNPIALGRSVARVDQGRQTEIEAATGKVGKVFESYATADGVYGMVAWDRPHNVGWSTLQLRMDAQGHISLTMRQRTDPETITREETCTLTKYARKLRA